MEILKENYLGTELYNWIIFFTIVSVGFLLRRVISKWVSHIIFLTLGKSAKFVGRDLFEKKVKKPLEFLTIIGSIYISGFYIKFSESISYIGSSLEKILLLIVVYGFIWLGTRMVDYLGEIFKHKADATEGKMDDQLVIFMIEVIKVFVWVTAILIILSNVFHVNVVTLVAGLGIVGLALAMASKESVENIIGSLTVFFDQPFKYGDVITIGGVTGTVQKIGFRSTEMITGDKTLVTFPNRNLITSTIENYSERELRKTNFNIELVHGTSMEKIGFIMAGIQAYLNPIEDIEGEPLVVFSGIEKGSMIIRIQYLTKVGFREDLEIKQNLLFKIMETVRENGSSFSSPNQTLVVENNG